jgi:hypothetical protein
MPIEFGSFSIGAAAGGFVVGLVNHFLTKSRDKESRAIKEFNEAAKSLRDAFGPELAALRSPSSDNPQEDPGILLFHAFEKHRVAVNAFRLFLKGIHQRSFDQAWHNYYSYDDSGVDPYEYLVKYGPGWESKPIQECRSLAIDNIERILAFANQK